MRDTTIHQARTFGDHRTDQHLMIEGVGTDPEHMQHAALRLFNESTISGRDVRATIYLDKAQWAELAKVAATLAESLEENTQSGEHWTNEQVVAWQEANVREHVVRTAVALFYALSDGRLALTTVTHGQWGERALELLVQQGVARVVPLRPGAKGQAVELTSTKNLDETRRKIERA